MLDTLTSLCTISSFARYYKALTTATIILGIYASGTMPFLLSIVSTSPPPHISVIK